MGYLCNLTLNAVGYYTKFAFYYRIRMRQTFYLFSVLLFGTIIIVPAFM